MNASILNDLARYYYVSDLSGATIPASRLRNILESLQRNHSLTNIAQSYLSTQGLIALLQLAQNETTYEAFCEAAAPEQRKRIQAAEAEKQAQAAEMKIRETAWAAKQEETRRARESDPKYIAKLRNQALRTRYGVEQFVQHEHFSKLMNILRRFDDGSRLTDEDVLWLATEGKDYYSDNLQKAFHQREAEFYTGEYKRTADPWNAVNASSHYRKCGQASEADKLLTSIPAKRLKEIKLRSAIVTTHGGVMRDLKHLDEALELGNQAHTLTPKDFRPCTLLGAVNVELGHYDIARDWYAKAIERGASERSIDCDLRGIFLHASPINREEIKAFLLREDPVRYQWVNDRHNRK